MITVVGTLAEYSKNYTATGTPIIEATVDVKGKPLSMRAKFGSAEVIDALLDGAEVGTGLAVSALMEFRKSTDGRVFGDIAMTNVFVLGAVGEQYAEFRFQGFLNGSKEVVTDKGSFSKGLFKHIAFDRNGVIDEALTEMSVNAADIGIWQGNTGKFAIVTGAVVGYRTSKGRVYPRYYADKLSVSDVPEWLTPYAPARPGAVVPPPVGAMANDPFAI